MRQLAIVTFMWVVALAACAAPTGRPGPSATESSTPRGQTGYEEIGCHDISLAGPDGERLNLTGLWGVPDAYPTWNAQHVGDCLFLVSLPHTDESDPLGSLRGSQQQEMCEGVLHTDFTVDLRCVQFSSISTYAGWGRTTWDIVFSESGGAEILPCHRPSQQRPCLIPPLVRYEYDGASIQLGPDATSVQFGRSLTGVNRSG